MDGFDVIHYKAKEARKESGSRDEVEFMSLAIGGFLLFSTMAGLKLVIDAAPAAARKAIG